MFVFLIGNWISWKLGTIEASLTLNPKFVKKFQRPCGKGVAYNSHFSALTCSNHSHLFRSSFGSSFSMKPCSFVFQMFIPLPSDGLCCSFSLFLFYCFYILPTCVYIFVPPPPPPPTPKNPPPGRGFEFLKQSTCEVA
jgi:hypothetical protein